MEAISKLQGSTINLSIDLSLLGVIDSVIFEIYSTHTKSVVHKFKHPTTLGYSLVTKVGDVYSFTLTSDQTYMMQSSYGVEMIWDKGGVIDKAKCEGINIEVEAK